MLNAYNNDIEYKNRWYHIQTEDNGVKLSSVTTTVFHSGQTLDCKSSSYQDSIQGVTDPEEINKIVKQHMVEQFQFFYKRLFEGYYDEKVSAMYAKVPKTPSIQVPGPNAIPKPSSPIVASVSQLPPAKPDILRASQQLSSLGTKGHSLKPVVVISSANANTTNNINHVAVLSKPIARSKAVTEAAKKSAHHAWAGVKWPNDDLALDVLVSTLLEEQPV